MRPGDVMETNKERGERASHIRVLRVRDDRRRAAVHEADERHVPVRQESRSQVLGKNSAFHTRLLRHEEERTGRRG